MSHAGNEKTKEDRKLHNSKVVSEEQEATEQYHVTLTQSVESAAVEDVSILPQQVYDEKKSVHTTLFLIAVLFLFLLNSH